MRRVANGPLHVIQSLTRGAKDAHAVDITAVWVGAKVEGRELRGVRQHARVEGLLWQQVVARILGACTTVEEARSEATSTGGHGASGDSGGPGIRSTGMEALTAVRNWSRVRTC